MASAFEVRVPEVREVSEYDSMSAEVRLAVLESRIRMFGSILTGLGVAVVGVAVALYLGSVKLYSDTVLDASLAASAEVQRSVGVFARIADEDRFLLRKGQHALADGERLIYSRQGQIYDLLSKMAAAQGVEVKPLPPTRFPTPPPYSNFKSSEVKEVSQ